jgi:hypothetical protein
LNSRLESGWDYGQLRSVAAKTPDCIQSTAASGGQASATENATQNANDFQPENPELIDIMNAWPKLSESARVRVVELFRSLAAGSQPE